MNRFLLILAFASAGLMSQLSAQCTPVNCLASLPAYGGICDTALVCGTIATAYSDFESFVITDECFAATLIDPTQPAGLNIRITNVDNFTFSGMPIGITVATNQASYSPPAGGNIAGCAEASGFPFEIGTFNIVIDFLADVVVCGLFPIVQNDNPASYTIELVVKPIVTYDGLAATYCLDDPASTLTPTGTTGGTFFGPGVTGTSFDPMTAGVGTHMVAYTVSRQDGLAVAPAADTLFKEVIVENCALPIELLSFEGSAQTNGNLIKWETATEINVSHFDVQRSTDGVNFTTVGTTAAVGPSAYQFVDPVSSEGVYYYRLKSVDLDETYDYSQSAVINREGNPAISIWPNPASSVMNIDLGTYEGLTQIKLYNNLGQLVLNSDEQGGFVSTIDVSEFGAGVYFLEINNQASSTVQQIVISE